MYHSEEVRRLAPEMDPLRLGMGWKLEDLEKPKVIIESTFGDSHPGSAHLLKFVDTAAAGVAAAGGRAARYFTTDICDGMAQGHDGINYSLASRDMIANMVEIHNNATPFDAGVFIASCDKGLPGLLMGIGRTDLPAVVVTGGVMEAGPDLLTLEQIGAYSAMCQRGEISEAQLTYYKHHACPSCGACSFMGTAGTMQVMCEALGLTLPGSALLPATSADLVEVARKAGAQAVELAKRGLTARDIVTRQFPALQTPSCIFRPSPMNSALRSMPTHSSASIRVLIICWMCAPPDAGRQNMSIMRAACPPSWKRCVTCSTSM